MAGAVLGRSETGVRVVVGVTLAALDGVIVAVRLAELVAVLIGVPVDAGVAVTVDVDVPVGVAVAATAEAGSETSPPIARTEAMVASPIVILISWLSQRFIC
jgi:hypothetical protein